MIWVLTAGFGDGHNTAARCISEGLRQQAPTQEVLVSDLVSDVHPLFSRVLMAAYQFAIIRCPWAWKSFYHYLARPGVGVASVQRMPNLLKTMANRIELERPQAIVSTYPLYASLAQALKDQGVAVPPIITVITDSVTVHPVWMIAPSDLYLVADDETKDVVIQKYGVAENKVQVTGFPVSLDFMKAPQPPADDAKQRILYFPSTPAAHVEQTLEALKPLLLNGVKLTMPVGKHGPRLYHVTRRFIDANPSIKLELVGWTNRIPELLQTHDTLITKAGGAILHEVMAARIPPVIDYVVPGQEEGNAAQITDNHCGLRSTTPQETADCLRRMLENQGALAATMRQNMSKLSVPDASIRAANAVLAIAEPILS